MELDRHENNPILKANKKNKWESKAVFNPGVAFYKGKFHMLYRAIAGYKKYKSRIGYAESTDGFEFTTGTIPVLHPQQDFEKWGCEDPRITRIGNKFYITYVALSKSTKMGGGPPRTALAVTKDFINFEKMGIITPEGADERDVVLFPGKIGGKFVMLHRPYNWVQKDLVKKRGKFLIRVKERFEEWVLGKKLPEQFPKKPSIWIAYSKDLKRWGNHKLVLKPKEKWEHLRVGADSPPIKTDAGWLLIYHGCKLIKSRKKIRTFSGREWYDYYHIGAVLLDLNDPSKVIARTKKPLLEPKRVWEKEGDVPNVVFATGAVVKGGTLYVYYGGADKVIGVATCKLQDLIIDMLKNGAKK